MAGVLPSSYKLPMMPSNLPLAFLTDVGLCTMQTSFFLEINRSAMTWLDLESSATKSVGNQWIHSGGTAEGGFKWMYLCIFCEKKEGIFIMMVRSSRRNNDSVEEGAVMAKINDKREGGEGGQLIHDPFWLICFVLPGGFRAK
jgi:hypothetical protein